jgi:uncharacterized protein YceK
MSKVTYLELVQCIRKGCSVTISHNRATEGEKSYAAEIHCLKLVDVSSNNGTYTDPYDI